MFLVWLIFSMNHLPPFVYSHSSSDLRPLFLKIRTGNCKNNDHRGYQLQHKCRHIEPKCDGIHKAEDKGTKHHSRRSHKNSSMSEKGTSDQQGCQCDGDHTLTDVDIYGFLRLRQKTSGKCSKCICHAKPDHVRKDQLMEEDFTISSIAVLGIARPDVTKERRNTIEIRLRWLQ